MRPSIVRVVLGGGGMIGREEETDGGSDRDKIKVFGDVGGGQHKFLSRVCRERVLFFLRYLCRPATRKTRMLPGVYASFFGVGTRLTWRPPYHHRTNRIDTTSWSSYIQTQSSCSAKTIRWDLGQGV